jgi:protein-tyrosine phosphatase
MSTINPTNAGSVGGPDATEAPADAAPADAPADAPAAAAAGASGTAIAAQGQAQTSWAARLWSHVKEDFKEAKDDIEHGIDNAENKILDAEEPKNTSGFTPPRPPDPLTGALNVGETALARLGLMHPFKTYTKWVDDGVLMRGSEQDAKGWQDLKDQGIKTVVNLRLEDNSEAATVRALGMNAVQIPSYDQSLPSHDELAAFVRTVNDPANQPVYVHCEQGVGRTGIMCAAYRVAHDGWSADQAIQEARQMGMKSSDQEQFIRQFAADVQTGKYAGEF